VHEGGCRHVAGWRTPLECAIVAPMRGHGRALEAFSGLCGLPFAALVACGGSAVSAVDAGGTKADSGGADVTVEAAVEGGGTQDANGAETDAPVSTDAGCLPLSVNGTSPFVAPSPPQSVCTLTQIQDLYADCWASSATTTACNAFYGDPSNSPCIRCMITPSSAVTWGAVVVFGDNYGYANLGGCLALLTGNAGPGSCARAVEALQQCEESSCHTGCPTGNSPEAGTILAQCHAEARTSTCSSAEQAVSCESASQNSGCDFADFQADFIGIGEILCVAATDGGADAASE
jgi:hypothetical protein